jgi:Uma2 family endonuclease
MVRGADLMSTIMTPETSLDPYAGISDDILFEVIDGKIVEKPSIGSYPVEIASILQIHLGSFVEQAALGRTIVEILFRITPTRIYRPDLAFISSKKWPISRRSPNKRPWNLVPDLTVEVVSENDTAWEVLAKTRIYFEAGVQVVWLIYPHLETIHVFDSFTRIHVLTKEDVLDGGSVIPGFQLPLTLLFRGEPAEEEESEEGD